MFAVTMFVTHGQIIQPENINELWKDDDSADVELLQSILDHGHLQYRKLTFLFLLNDEEFPDKLSVFNHHIMERHRPWWIYRDDKDEVQFDFNLRAHQFCGRELVNYSKAAERLIQQQIQQHGKVLQWPNINAIYSLDHKERFTDPLELETFMLGSMMRQEQYKYDMIVEFCKEQTRVIAISAARPLASVSIEPDQQISFKQHVLQRQVYLVGRLGPETDLTAPPEGLPVMILWGKPVEHSKDKVWRG